jgi:coiled-coil domain-containing protein 40
MLQVETYNEAMKGEIAVVRRAAYAAEGAVAAAERDKLRQDLRIDELQSRVKAQQQALQLVAAQVEAQARETRAAQETLAQAESEMAGVHFEKKQLVAQWKSSLNAISKWGGDMRSSGVLFK